MAPGAILALCHCHYPDLVPELARLLRRLPRGAVLHVTSSRPDVLEAWERERRAVRVPLHVHRVENRGRDIRPFFAVARDLHLPPGAIVLKLHGKKSPYTAQGDRWRQDLTGGLLPDAFAAHRTLARFRADPDLAMVGPPRSFVSHPVYWGGNRQPVAAVLSAWNGRGCADEDLGFFAGSMFWIEGGFLASVAKRVDLDAFEPEPLPQDGGYAHVIERALAMAARQRGRTVAEIGLPGPIDPDRVRARKVPYL